MRNDKPLDAATSDIITDAGRTPLEALVAKTGAKPLPLEILRAMREIWPAEESVDEFLEARERWQTEPSESLIP